MRPVTTHHNFSLSHLRAERTTMATINTLKHALRQKALDVALTLSLTQPLSDIQYSNDFDILNSGPGWLTYQDFIIPQLAQLLEPLFKSVSLFLTTDPDQEAFWDICRAISDRR